MKTFNQQVITNEGKFEEATFTENNFDIKVRVWCKSCQHYENKGNVPKCMHSHTLIANPRGFCGNYEMEATYTKLGSKKLTEGKVKSAKYHAFLHEHLSSLMDSWSDFSKDVKDSYGSLLAYIHYVYEQNYKEDVFGNPIND